MGSFEPWDRLMSGVLAYAGEPAFLTDMKERRSESDFMAAYWRAHIHWLHQHFGGEEFTTRKVQEAALKDPAGYEAPPQMDDSTGKDFTRRLGMAYSRHRDRNYDGVRLVKSGLGHGSTLKWRTVSDNGGTEVAGGTAPTPRVGETPSLYVRSTCSPKGEGGSAPSSPLPASTPDPWDVPNAPRTLAELDSLAETGALVLDIHASGPLDHGEPTALGFDLETASADELFRGRHEGPFVRLVGGEGGVGPVTCTDPSALVDDLNRAEVIYGHNILGFDLIALAHHHGADYDALAAKAIDTFTLSQLAWPSGAKGDREDYTLDAVAKRLGHTGKSDDLKALAKEFGGYDKIPVNDERYRDYLRGDLAATAHVYDQFAESTLGWDGLSDYARREMKVAAIQNRMTLNGWRVDTALLAERVAHEDAQRTEAAQQLAERFGMPLAPPDKIRLKLKADWPEGYADLYSATLLRRYAGIWPDAAVRRGLATRHPQPPSAAPWATDAGRAALEAAFRAAGATFYPTTPSGKLALSADALGEGTWYDKSDGKAKPGMQNPKALELMPGVDADAVRELCSLITQATGATAKYAEIQEWTTPSGRVHAEMSDVQASGRWATKHPASANLDAPPREVFVPEPGHVLITCDMSQVDVRAMAGHSQDPELIAALQPGKDYHSEMAAVFFGDRSRRSDGKPISHGLNYNQGDRSIAEKYGLEIGMVTAARVKHKEKFHVLAEWTANLVALAETGVLLDNGFGRLMKCDPQRAYTQAPALMGQGAARDLMCEGLLRLVARDSAVTPYLRGVVHDEVILSVPAEEAEYWRDELETAFTFEWKGVPILCSVSNAGANWLECEH